MEIAKVIIIINIIVWLLPPFRQYQSRFFKYFIVLALADLITLLFVEFLHVEPLKTSFVLSLILLVIIINLNKPLPYYQIITSILIVVMLFYFNIKFYAILISAIHIIIFFYFTVITIQYYYLEEKLIFYHFALLFYEISVVLKFIFWMIDIEKGMVYFYSTSMLQILLAIYFCWDVEERSKITLLSKKPEN